MIQRPTAGAFDLELSVLTHAGEKSIAIATTAVFQHGLQSLVLLGSATLARAGGLGWLAGTVCRLVAAGGARNTVGGRPLFSPDTQKPRTLAGLLFWSRHKKARLNGRALQSNLIHAQNRQDRKIIAQPLIGVKQQREPVALLLLALPRPDEAPGSPAPRSASQCHPATGAGSALGVHPGPRRSCSRRPSAG